MITELEPHRELHHVSASAEIAAPAADVYHLIADYREGHPRLLPSRFFRNLRVEDGGYGAGTIITFDMFAFGRMQHLRGQVTEPEPGRVLGEAYPDLGSVTTFTVEPLGTAQSRVTIATALRARPGILGRLELSLMTRYLRRVYAAELTLIEHEAGGSNRDRDRAYGRIRMTPSVPRLFASPKPQRRHEGPREVSIASRSVPTPFNKVALVCLVRGVLAAGEQTAAICVVSAVSVAVVAIPIFERVTASAACCSAGPAPRGGEYATNGPGSCRSSLPLVPPSRFQSQVTIYGPVPRARDTVSRRAAR